MWLRNLKGPISRLARWRVLLSEYECEIIHKPGRVDANTDALSRNPVQVIGNVNLNAGSINDNINESQIKAFIGKIFRIVSTSQPTCERELPAGIIASAGECHVDDACLPISVDDYDKESFAHWPSHADDACPPIWVDKCEKRKEICLLDSPGIGVNRANDGYPSVLPCVGMYQVDEIMKEETNSVKNSSTSCDSVSSGLSDEDDRRIEEFEIPIEGANSASVENTHPVLLIERVTYSRDQLMDMQDNLAHFMAVDCKIGTPLCQQLVDAGFLDLKGLQDQNIGLGAIVQTKLQGGRRIYSLFVKENVNDAPEISVICTTLESLGYNIVKEGVQTVSNPKNKDGLERLPWQPIEATIKSMCNQHNLRVTICTGEVITPLPQDHLAIIKEAHDSVVGGHKGVAKTYNRIRDGYFWLGMKEEIEEYVRFCEECQRKKLVRVKPRQPMTITSTPEQAFEVLGIDIVGSLPLTTSGNKYILTLQCNLTKYSYALPSIDTTAEMVATSFVFEFICRFGCPHIIKTDQGSNFQSAMMAKVAKIFKINHIRSTAFRPQTMGSLERSHHSLVEYLKMYTNQAD